MRSWRSTAWNRGVARKRIVDRVHLERGHREFVLAAAALQPVQRPVVFPQTEVNDGEHRGGNPGALLPLLQLTQHLARPLRLAAQGVDLAHRAQDVGNISGQRPALFQHADGVQELSLLGIDAAQ